MQESRDSLTLVGQSMTTLESMSTWGTNFQQVTLTFLFTLVLTNS